MPDRQCQPFTPVRLLTITERRHHLAEIGEQAHQQHMHDNFTPLQWRLKRRYPKVDVALATV
jgi:hypothetical protein